MSAKPLEGFEAGCELVKLRFFLVLDSMIKELTDFVHLLVAQVAIRSEIKRRGRKFN